MFEVLWLVNCDQPTLSLNRFVAYSQLAELCGSVSLRAQSSASMMQYMSCSPQRNFVNQALKWNPLYLLVCLCRLVILLFHSVLLSKLMELLAIWFIPFFNVCSWSNLIWKLNHAFNNYYTSSVCSSWLIEKVDQNTTLHGCCASILSGQFDSNVRKGCHRLL